MIFLKEKIFGIVTQKNGLLEAFIFPIMPHLQAFGVEWFIDLDSVQNK